MSMLIKNGKIISHKDSYLTDIFIENGKIKRIGKENYQNLIAENQINAENLLIFPGGIDPHVHMHLPTPAGFSSDDFYSGSKAALFGGTTTIIDFVTPKRGQSLVEALKERKEEAKLSLADYKFHVSPVEWIKNTEKEILHCIKEEGIKSFKVYMAYKNTIGLDNEDILKVMKVVGKAGGIVTVHAELGDEIETLRNQFAANGQLSPKYHPLSRPANTEALAVKKVIELAAEANCPVYIVHVSTKDSVDYIREAQAGGQVVYAETCPHYLILDDMKYEGSFEQSSAFVLSPPLRKKADQQALWQAIADGVIQTIGTDHCPFTVAQKRKGSNDFRQIPNGAGGVEHRLALLYTFGVLQNRISLNQFVDLCSTKAAKIFGFYPTKGEIKIGSDADITIWNPGIKNTISAKTHHMDCDNNIFEGISTIGAADYVISNGKLVYNRNRPIDITNQMGHFTK